ncbi:4-hydroxythreonine-4-phosphate dehydrogenase PdxA [Paracoccus siganidrum]|uniref:4-hydroxythreonine-4-phosphate dehydrogenase n=1 Tax=Paracoccus siganidrum TaxID=1276757 RepID=A0A419A792_9RHOB|nr:4-hydroxythreonine-4-phosphate dehydrogenase PdxA [Paracoccus siganidrum]RJL16520.1 4-hydroxythreonine-4-phosphate dehydrogenase [Paracoccus siganidrum]RMC38367.1 4-hydroxythreonine-4-phosphate dehydrogenase [Paracoccus siganidrum]
MRIALAIGDAGGVGPELAAKLLAHEGMRDRDVIVVGDASVLRMGAEHAGVDLDLAVIRPDQLTGDLPAGQVMVDLANCPADQVQLGASSAAAGAASLQNFAAVLRLAQAGIADAVMFTPFNKHSMRLARPSYVDEIGFIDMVLGSGRSGREFNVLDEVWNARVTSHIPLSEVAGKMSVGRILDSLRLTHEVMTGAGKPAPRIGVAALNPHAGDGRNFGHEDEDIIAPAVEAAVAEGVDAKGPIPSDTVFVRAVRGEFDAVLTMYHDQGQIAMKLMGFDRGVTLIAGYGFPIVTPAHGTAFDIAGQGKADLGATLAAARLGSGLAALNPPRRGQPALSAGWSVDGVAEKALVAE